MKTAYDSIPSNDIKMVIGDLNAKLGWEDIYKGVNRKHSLHLETKNNEQSYCCCNKQEYGNCFKHISPNRIFIK
jgi:hypothetical protein